MVPKNDYNSHTIAIIGGSISGSEAAYLLATNDFKIVVFEMNALPYGKIEDGLPNWHINLRNRQMKAIDANLSHPNITVVPMIKVGTDFSFEDLLNEWKFSAVILANGAWFDRRLSVPGSELLTNDSLVYQNPFIYWFNHKHESNYQGDSISLKNKIIVVGGGLASLDVVKAIMIEKVGAKISEKYEVRISPFDIEKKGVSYFLDVYNETLESLKIEQVHLMYRRAPGDMPLKSPKNDSKEEILKAKEISLRMLTKYLEKYQFEVLSHTMPVGIEQKEGILKGVFCKRTTVENGKVRIIENSEFLFECDQIISSIGSLPEEISGLPYEYGALQMKGEEKYQVSGYSNVFAVGNAVTGRGNIQESKQHGRKMTSKIIEEHLSQDALETWVTGQNERISERVKVQVEGIVSEVKKQPKPDTLILKNIETKIGEIHARIKFTSYSEWISNHIPERLEDQISDNA